MDKNLMKWKVRTKGRGREENNVIRKEREEGEK